MSIFNDKALKGVAEAAAKIMAETSHGTHPKTPKEKSLAALAHPKDKITHKDVLVGRGVLKKEQKELKEETEQLQEYESKGGVYKHKGNYGTSYKTDEEGNEIKPAKQKGYGARQNYVRGTSTGEKKKMKESLSFTEMLELYNEHGLKVLAPIETEEMDIDGTTIEVIDADKVNGVVATIVEEPTNDEFTKEFEDQKASFEGKKKQPKVAAGKTTGVKVMPEEVEQIDEISADLAGKYLTAPQGKGANKYKVEPGKSRYPNAETMFKHTASVKRALQRSDTSSLNKKPSYYKEEVELDEQIGEEEQKKHPFVAVHAKKGKHETHGSTSYEAAKNAAKHWKMKNTAGIDVYRADKKHVAEEVEQIDERTLTSGEAKKKEEYVKGMKKGLSGFKQRYGERAKSVMYATATKMAKKD